MTQSSHSTPRIRRPRLGRRAAFLLAIAIAAAVLVAFLLPPWLSAYAREQAITRTSEHFDADVAIEALQISVFPSLRLEGHGLTLRRRDSRSAPPLITLHQFSATASILTLLRGRVDRVTINGMAIDIPPDGPDDDDERQASDGGSIVRDAGGTRPAAPSDGPASDAPTPEETDTNTSGLRGLRIAEIVCSDVILTIAPDDPDGTAQIFDIRDVTLDDFALDRPARYRAHLINPRPRGPITSEGLFGPWSRRAPRLTPLSGRYEMSAADMSVFKGIAGRLTTAGQFSGVLESIDVQGTSTMADFSVDVGGHPMRLDTTYHARVDGTNGNTYLNSVEARLGESVFVAKGEIAGTPGVDGKRIVLDVTSKAGRLEDFITLVVRGDDPPLSGRIALDTHLDLPPGDIPVAERIELDGTFTISEGQFTAAAVQDRIDELSRRGQGKPRSTSIDDVVSTFSGRYTMKGGVIALPQLHFRVSGAEVRIGGRYSVSTSALDFKGHLRLAVPLSKTTTGVKSWLLKAVDPFFSKNGAGAEIPIKLGGTTEKPAFGLNMSL